MKIHRFYTGTQLQLKKDFWVHDEALLWQWNKVLRFREGQQLVLFDGEQTDRLYKIEHIDKNEAHLVMVTELARQLPERHVYLFWSLLKKDKNDWVLQKCTELGVSNFIPLISERGVRDNFNHERARKIVIEASEQCERSNIPTVREPMYLKTAMEEYSEKIKLLVCEQGNAKFNPVPEARYGLLVGPEGGWSEEEKNLFENAGIQRLGLGDFTLRAETAAIAASVILM